MVIAFRVIATIILAYVVVTGYPLFVNSPAVGTMATVYFFLAAGAGWLLAFFGGDVAELFDVPPFGTLLRIAGVLLLLVLGVVGFMQRHAA